MPTPYENPIAPNLATDSAGQMVPRVANPNNNTTTDTGYGYVMPFDPLALERGREGRPVADLGGRAFNAATYEAYDDEYQRLLDRASRSYRASLEDLPNEALLQRALESGKLLEKPQRVSDDRPTMAYKVRVRSQGGGGAEEAHVYSSVADYRKKLKDLATPQWQQTFPPTSETRSSADLGARIAEERAKSAPDQGLLAKLEEDQRYIKGWEDFLANEFPDDKAGRSALDGARKFDLVVGAMHNDPELMKTVDAEQRKRARITSEAQAFQLARKRLPGLEAHEATLRLGLEGERHAYRRDPLAVDDISGLESPAEMLRAFGLSVDGEIGDLATLNEVEAKIEKLESRRGAGITSDEMAGEVADAIMRMRRKEDAVNLRHYSFIETAAADKIIQEIAPILRAGGRVLLMGPPGVAKTRILRYMVEKGYLGDPPGKPREVVVISVNKQLTEERLVGSKELQATGDKGAMETKFVAQGILRAAAEGLPVILDEVNTTDAGLLKLINDIMTAEPGTEIRYGDADPITVKKGFCVVATANVGSTTELSARYGGTVALSDEFKDRYDAKIHIDYPDINVAANYWRAGSDVNYPIDTLRMAIAKFTNDEGVFLPGVNSSIAGITEDDLVKFALIAHTLQQLSTLPKSMLEQVSPELFAELTSGGNVADGLVSKDYFDMAEPEDTMLRSGVLSPRTFDKKLDTLHRTKGGHEGMEKVLRELVDGLTEESDKNTVRKVCQSFGYLDGTARRTDFKLPGLAELYPEVSAEVQTAYEAAKAKRQELGDAAAVAAEAAARGQLPDWRKFIATQERENTARAQAKAALEGWQKIAANIGLGASPGSIEQLMARAGTPERTENLARQLNRLVETRSRIIGSGANTQSGANLGEQMRIVMVPVAALLAQANAGGLKGWIDNARLGYSAGRPVYRGPDDGPVKGSGFNNAPGPYNKIYADPRGSGSPVDIVEYLTARQEQFGDWMPVLAAPLNDPLAFDPTTQTFDSYNELKLGKVSVTGGGIIEYLAQSMQTQGDLGTLDLALPANQWAGGNGRIGMLLERQQTGGFAAGVALASRQFSRHTSPYVAVA